MVVGGRELIDTLWNVNFPRKSLFLQVVWELIDTLWNVNAAMGRGRIINGIELIDTLWNVNTISPSVGSSGTVN